MLVPMSDAASMLGLDDVPEHAINQSADHNRVNLDSDGSDSAGGLMEFDKKSMRSDANMDWANVSRVAVKAKMKG